MKKWISVAFVLIWLLSVFTGCGDTGPTDSDGRVSGGTETSADTSGQAEANPVQADTDVFTERDYKTDYDESGSVLIQLNGSTATATSDSVRISGTTITIKKRYTVFPAHWTTA